MDRKTISPITTGKRGNILPKFVNKNKQSLNFEVGHGRYFKPRFEVVMAENGNFQLKEKPKPNK